MKIEKFDVYPELKFDDATYSFSNVGFLSVVLPVMYRDDLLTDVGLATLTWRNAHLWVFKASLHFVIFFLAVLTFWSIFGSIVLSYFSTFLGHFHTALVGAGRGVFPSWLSGEKLGEFAATYNSLTVINWVFESWFLVSVAGVVFLIRALALVGWGEEIDGRACGAVGARLTVAPMGLGFPLLLLCFFSSFMLMAIIWFVDLIILFYGYFMMSLINGVQIPEVVFAERLAFSSKTTVAFLLFFFLHLTSRCFNIWNRLGKQFSGNDPVLSWEPFDSSVFRAVFAFGIVYSLFSGVGSFPINFDGVSELVLPISVVLLLYRTFYLFRKSPRNSNANNLPKKYSVGVLRFFDDTIGSFSIGCFAPALAMSLACLFGFGGEVNVLVAGVFLVFCSIIEFYFQIERVHFSVNKNSGRDL